jgi:integration host factor subunit beta
MNKSDLISILSQEGDLPTRKSEDIVNTVFDIMSDALIGGDRIEIRGFGSFMVKEYDGYTGRNPKTSETIVVPGKKLPFFKMGKELKEKVDGQVSHSAVSVTWNGP